MKQYIPPVLLFGTWLFVAIIFLTPETPNGHGVPHERIAGMDQGGPGLERHRGVLIPGWLLGSTLIAGFVSLLAWNSLGPRPRGSEPRQYDRKQFTRRDAVFLAGGAAVELTFAMMCLAYYRSVVGESPVAFIGPFPSGLSWLLFGMWLIPAVFVVLYVVFFEQWIAPHGSLERFKQLLEERDA